MESSLNWRDFILCRLSGLVKILPITIQKETYGRETFSKTPLFILSLTIFYYVLSPPTLLLHVVLSLQLCFQFPISKLHPLCCTWSPSFFGYPSYPCVIRASPSRTTSLCPLSFSSHFFSPLNRTTPINHLSLSPTHQFSIRSECLCVPSGASSLLSTSSSTRTSTPLSPSSPMRTLTIWCNSVTGLPMLSARWVCLHVNLSP